MEKTTNPFENVDSYIEELSTEERINFLRSCASHVRDACRESKLRYNYVEAKNE